MSKVSIAELIEKGATRAEIMAVVDKEIREAEIEAKKEKARADETKRRAAHREDVIAILNHLDNIMLREGLINETDLHKHANSPMIEMLLDAIVEASQDTMLIKKAFPLIPSKEKDKSKSEKVKAEDDSIDAAIKNFLRTL
jgi:hypothetical protein